MKALMPGVPMGDPMPHPEAATDRPRSYSAYTEILVRHMTGRFSRLIVSSDTEPDASRWAPRGCQTIAIGGYSSVEGNDIR